MVVAIFAQPSSLHAQEIDMTGYIKNIDTETVVLVSNNILGGEICSYQEESPSSSCGSEPLVLTFSSDKNLLSDNKARLYGLSIHNLSTNLKDIQKIRAP